MMAALRNTHQSIGLSEESLAVPVSLLPGQESYNLDADAGTPRALKALQQTAGLVKVGVKLSRK